MTHFSQSKSRTCHNCLQVPLEIDSFSKFLRFAPSTWASSPSKTFSLPGTGPACSPCLEHSPQRPRGRGAYSCSSGSPCSNLAFLVRLTWPPHHKLHPAALCSFHSNLEVLIMFTNIYTCSASPTTMPPLQEYGFWTIFFLMHPSPQNSVRHMRPLVSIYWLTGWLNLQCPPPL